MVVYVSPHPQTLAYVLVLTIIIIIIILLRSTRTPQVRAHTDI